ncbi:tRNA (guanosine(46)-N7)-methyltransferase TrmB [Anaeromicropila herbilytica]|uniref:tRNA (guanine-N(7)-)-methyltransferase n=1 Tax=Anaeromicropila herbilytica TaxID=2785025 RepID=A0A7R7EQB2_9FIRM|nr:tRNA (guanosine(46)-N7)-methyltransferase TrmB [Anaeromicropila herbilytica]BCN32999.1 tRNA (guanine-N(7)-)-methyltransferase [Anaeromicropila herbilytica]
MRLRNVKGAREKIESNQYVIENPSEYKGKWDELFKNNNPIHIEIGMGKGKFIKELADSNRDINYIGIEKFSSVLIRALEKREELISDNLYYIRMDAESIMDIFDKDEVKRIYLNFSDPWPKDRHAKRRLTSKEFFARYNNVLDKEGEVIFKTDNKDLFDFSLEQVELAKWNLVNYTYDLHNSEYVEGNVMTEYEAKFVTEGKKINRLVASR